MGSYAQFGSVSNDTGGKQVCDHAAVQVLCRERLTECADDCLNEIEGLAAASAKVRENVINRLQNCWVISRYGADTQNVTVEVQRVQGLALQARRPSTFRKWLSTDGFGSLEARSSTGTHDLGAKGRVDCRAGLDVFEGLSMFDPTMQLCDHPLFSMENVILSPHCGGFSIEALESLSRDGARTPSTS